MSLLIYDGEMLLFLFSNIEINFISILEGTYGSITPRMRRDEIFAKQKSFPLPPPLQKFY